MDNKNFTIEEAVEYTGIKRRTFERMNIGYEKESRTAKDGKEREVRVYSREELDRVKEKKSQKKYVPSLVVPTGDNQSAQVVTLSDLQTFAGFIVEGLVRENQKLLAPPETKTAKKIFDLANLKDKQILNFSQAVAYSGLPAKDIKAALINKNIAGKKTGAKGIWQIYRISLDEFCKNYFN